MTPDEHLAWAHGRAAQYLDSGDTVNALASMLSDLRKHPETARLADLAPLTTDPRRVADWLDGFGA